MTAFLLALIPSIGVSLLFWLAIRAIVHADRAERSAAEIADAQRTDPSEQARKIDDGADDGMGENRS
jgi:hypothetical protein